MTAPDIPKPLRELVRTRAEHRCEYCWSEDGTRLMGLTACGRATIEALKLNHPLIVVARMIWVSIGLYPPPGYQAPPE